MTATGEDDNVGLFRLLQLLVFGHPERAWMQIK